MQAVADVPAVCGQCNWERRVETELSINAYLIFIDDMLNCILRFGARQGRPLGIFLYF